MAHTENIHCLDCALPASVCAECSYRPRLGDMESDDEAVRKRAMKAYLEQSVRKPRRKYVESKTDPGWLEAVTELEPIPLISTPQEPGTGFDIWHKWNLDRIFSGLCCNTLLKARSSTAGVKERLHGEFLTEDQRNQIEHEREVLQEPSSIRITKGRACGASYLEDHGDGAGAGAEIVVLDEADEL